MKIAGRILLSASLLFGAWLFAAESGYDVFQKGLAKERTEADYRGAIKLYERVLKEHAGDRKLAAQALFRIGECQQELGSAEAHKVFERVVKEYSDQAEIVAQAQARLAGRDPNAAGKSLRQIASGADIPRTPGGSSISPDGRHLASYLNREIVVYDLVARTSRVLARMPETQDASDGALKWSRDGKKLAFSTWQPADKARQLGVVNADGSDMRVLLGPGDGKAGSYLEGWSPDGKRILGVTLDRAKDQFQLLWVDVASGATQTIPLSVRLGRPQLALSPDGEYIAFSRRADQKDPLSKSDVYLISSKGSEETKIASDIGSPISDEPPIGWSRDSKYVLSIRFPGPSLWAIPVAGGKASGEPVMVQREFENDTAQFLGVTASGALYYSVLSGSSDIYTANLDPATGKISSAAPVPTSRPGRTVLPRWSPDGGRLVYGSANPISAAASVVPENREVFIHSFANGADQSVGVGIPLAGFGFCWSDDQTIQINRLNPQGGSEPVRLALNTKRTTPLFSDKTSFMQGSCSAQAITNFNQTSIRVRSLADGAAKLVYTPSSNATVRTAVLSHNGRFVAFVETRPDGSSALLVIPATGGTPRELVRATNPSELRYPWGAAWSHDDRFLYFVRRPDLTSPDEIFRIPAEGGAEQSTGLKIADLRDLNISPDGTRIAFSVGAVAMPEIWALENFLPRPGK